MTAPLTAGKLQQSANLNLDKLPVLQSVLERLAAMSAEFMRDYCAAPAQVFLNQAEGGSSWDVLEAYDDSVAVIFTVPEWNARILIGLDRRFIYTLMEALYGGDMSEPPFITVRPFTVLEARVARQMAEHAAGALKTAFASVASISLDVERVETSVDFSTLGQTNYPVITVQLLFQIQESGGRMFIIIPQAALGPIRQRLETERAPSTEGLLDEAWTARMQNRVVRTDMPLQAVCDGGAMTLTQAAGLTVGQVLPLPPVSLHRVSLECAGEKLFVCSLAQADGYFALMLNEPAADGGDMLDAILAGET
jgi:flagellar motor switch protein FliM